MNPQIPASGVIDLSQLAPTPPPPAGASWVQDVTEATFESVLQLSGQHLVVLELFSPRAQAQDMSDALARATNEAQGKWLLARINVDENPSIAQALQVQAVPTVAAVLAGQLLPLWQGTRDAADIKAVMSQVVAAAQQNGVTGKAAPVAGAADADAADPRFAAADAALERGDFAAAEAAFDELIAANPADAEAKAGKASIGLLRRTQGTDPDAALQRAQEQPEDLDAQLAAADALVAQGRPEEGFEVLLDVVRRGSEHRDAAKQRLLELFDAVGGTHPAVLRARRDLMTALF